MHKTTLFLLALFLVSCSGTPVPTAPTDPAPVSVDAPSPSTNKCFPAGVPSSPALVTVAPGECKAATKVVRDDLDTKMKKRYAPSIDGATLAIEHGCDDLEPTIDEIVFERGSGHGFSLEMWRLVRATDGASFQVHGLAYADKRLGDDPSITRSVPKTARGSVPADEVAPLLTTARATLAVKLTEIEPPPRKDGSFGMSGSGSSADYHLLIRLRDAAGRTLQGHYTGYPGSSSQFVEIPLLVAAAPFHDLVDKFEFAEVEPTASDRALFAERFVDGATRFDDDFAWWVMERQVSMARSFGSPAVIPGLLTRLPQQKEEGRSSIDARRDAIEAIANTSGWDVRRDAAGAERPAAEVAKDYLEECGALLRAD